ncbi:hypothetical protein IAQ61_003670 [Plenodomus lingam]|uniref:Predicted protein n=1 Tax=Leptosphaeria maculans (strain JN3 / isolate v23.1.3 / race Av1-4-5-6-7-8) TaxID=985895 RepID=E4ZRB9_LEPMJ|nr:predicted protein [Plenodomus lingam JN3]KAH9874481.1 hypothetical protein IAQ61_003670 [Plenodomus lingam]CBX93784.1 predicted protein [Plenodomus lingam JN3]
MLKWLSLDELSEFKHESVLLIYATTLHVATTTRIGGSIFETGRFQLTQTMATGGISGLYGLQYSLPYAETCSSRAPRPTTCTPSSTPLVTHPENSV